MRNNILATLAGLGLILAILPLRETRSFSGNPSRLLDSLLNPATVLSADQVARMIVSEDPSLQLIDVRPADEYKRSSLPGAINIPLEEFLVADPQSFLRTGPAKNVFYSNGDLGSGYAATIAAGLGYSNCYTMNGGMNEWIRTVMNTRFTGGTISARENALFETRTRASRLFTEMNSLPDSLKAKYLASKKFNPKKLDGGCE